MVSRRGADTPLLTLVVPTYDVIRFLPDFLSSLDAQRLSEADRATVEVLFVDDGSTDGSGSAVEAWAATAALEVSVVRQDNQGLSGARNRGLDLARGTWVSFPDPDDVLGDRYLTTVLAQLRHADPGVALVATRILLLTADGTISDTHRLNGRFAGGSRVVDLRDEPEMIHLQAASACYRRDLLDAHWLRFDASVRPHFEDAFLTALYLAAAPAPVVALLADAQYVYRRRDDGTSLIQQAYARPEKYTVLPRQGYLRLLTVFAERGPIPTWVQNLVLYDLLFYFREDQRVDAATAGLDPALCDAFLEAAGEILALVDPEVLADFGVMPTPWTLRQALRLGFLEPEARVDRAYLWRMDPEQQLVQARYLYGRVAPVETFRVGGRVVEPVHAKVRDLRWFGRTLAHERIAWLAATAPLRLGLDGRSVALAVGEPEESDQAEADAIWRRLARRTSPAPRPRRPRRDTPSGWASSRRDDAPAGVPTPMVTPSQGPPGSHRPGRRAGSLVKGGLRRLSRKALRRPAPVAPVSLPTSDRGLRAQARGPAARRFADAWAFGDDDLAAGDNAEHLYRWVRDRHPEIRSWFVLSRLAPDHDRLAADGFALVDPESEEFVLLMLNTAHRIFSRADDGVLAPLDAERFGRVRGRFTYLPRTLVDDAAARRIDTRRISLVASSTVAELQRLAGDHSPYQLTTKEVALTGMPRHDRLVELAASVPEPRLLLVAPSDDAARERWQALLGDPDVLDRAERRGLELALLVDGVAGVTGVSGVAGPPGVSLVRTRDVQEVLAQTAVLVTDRASLALDATVLGRPVLWFGPTGQRPSDALAAALAERQGPGQTGPWAGIVPVADGGCCARVVDRIRTLAAPAPQALELTQSWVTSRRVSPPVAAEGPGAVQTVSVSEGVS